MTSTVHASFAPVNHLGGTLYGDGEYVVAFENATNNRPLTATVFSPTGHSYTITFLFGEETRGSVKLARKVIKNVRADERGSTKLVDDAAELETPAREIARLADDRHRVVAVTQDGTKITAGSQSWRDAAARWDELDAARRAGRTPHIRHFSIRHADDQDWAGASYKPRWFRPVVAGRGFESPQAAAKRAAKLHLDAKTPNGEPQGTGGWYYVVGQPIHPQGVHGLVQYLQGRQLLVQANGRWFVIDKTPVPTTSNA